MAESIVKELAPMIFQVIAQIPYGRVASYGQIARLAGIPKHARLVGYVLKHMDADSSCLLYTSPSPRDRQKSRMPSSA